MQPPPPRPSLRRRLAFFGVLLFFGGILVAFRSVLLPFMVATLMVLVMEPVVRRLSRAGSGRRRLPRWASVLIVYSSFFLTLGLVGALAGPTLGEEAQKLISDAPRFFQRVKSEWIPEVNDFLRNLMRKFSPEEPGKSKDLSDSAARGPAWRAELREVGERAWAQIRARAQPAAEPGVDSIAARTALERALREPQSALLVKRLADGSYSVQLQGTLFELRETGKGRYQLQLREREKPWRRDAESEIDVERALEERLHGFVDSLGARLVDAVSVGRELVVRLASGLGLIALTFVIAAFLSIDLEGVMRFLRSLVPRSLHDDFDDLLRDLDRGLTGVIRGQLLICVINGILTAVGLYLLGVPYAGIFSLLAGAMSLIPIFGTILSSAPMIGVSLFTTEPTGLLGLSGIGLAIAVFVWILFIHFLEANILEPKIIGRTAKIHPVLVLFALLAGQHVAGIAGLIFAVPVLSVVQTLFVFIKNRLYGEQAPPAAGAAGQTGAGSG